MLAAGLMLALFAMNGVFSSKGVGAATPARECTSAVLSSCNPGAAVQITLESTTSTDAILAVEPGSDITVDFGTTGFVLPETIAEQRVQIKSFNWNNPGSDPNTLMNVPNTTGFNGNPSEVLIDGSKVILTVPSLKADNTAQTFNATN